MKPPLVREGESVDGLFRNKVRVIQAARGYRVSEDALILTGFVRPRPNERILDAGTGCGVIAFGLAIKELSVSVVGLEIQEALCDRAGRGVRLNRLEGQVSIVRGDLREADLFFRSPCFDAVVCNPPYYEPDRGRLNVLEEKALARHQLLMPSPVLFRVSGRLLHPGGRLALIYPAGKIDQIRQAMFDTGFKPSRMLWIHPCEGAAPGLACIEARPGRGAVDLIEDSLFLYDRQKRRTSEAEAIMAGEQMT
ncbi:MAG: methyltransferase [Deltaproteobacteria bacterium]